MNLRPFQIFLLAAFMVAAIVAIIILSSYQSKKSAAEQLYGNSVVIWGTLDADIVNDFFLDISQTDKAFLVVKYVEVDPRSFDERFVNAIAEGRSPDMVLLSGNNLVKHRAKLLPIPYGTISERYIRDTYVDGVNVFARPDGVYAIPALVDPLMLYWNRDIFASNGLAQPPTTWETVVANVVPNTTIRDAGRNLVQSGIAFGEYRNVQRAKDILLLLALQSGSDAVTENDRGYTVGLNSSATQTSRAPLEAAVEFFTNFSNVNSSVYSWNRAQPQDAQAFTAGDLAMYFGRASEVQGIADKNPNLNFDIAPVPQGGNATAQRTYGTFYGFAIPRASGNSSGAYAAAQTITSATNLNQLSDAFDMAPVRRDLIAAGSNNPFRAVVLQTALTAQTWLDPNPVASDTIFMQMIEDVVSNRKRIGVAVSDAIGRLVLEY